MRFVRQGAKRRSAPDVLTAAEIRALIDHLALRERTLVLLAASTGLRQSGLFGFKWRDVDFQHGELSVVRSIVFGVVGLCKFGVMVRRMIHPDFVAQINLDECIDFLAAVEREDHLSFKATFGNVKLMASAVTVLSFEVFQRLISPLETPKIT